MTVDQLHDAVVEISKNCFELKKLCVTLVISAGVFLQAFTKNETRSQLNGVFFGSAALVVFFFWILDGVNYYYQIKLRILMTTRANELQAMQGARNELVALSPVRGGFDAIENRPILTMMRRSYHSLVNASMLFYLLLIAVDILLFGMYLRGWLRT